MRDAKIVVADVEYGLQPIQELAQQFIELLVLNRYTFSNPIHSHTEPVEGNEQ